MLSIVFHLYFRCCFAPSLQHNRCILSSPREKGPVVRWCIAGKKSGSVAHILFSLVPEEAIFWIRSWPSSVLSSPRVLVRSSRFFDHSWPALILLEDCDIVSDGFARSSVVVKGGLLVSLETGVLGRETL